jgi:hypothetical protein
MFDPKVEAEGAALRAKRASLESDARYNNARAAGVEDQNSSLGEAYLKANGYTDQEIAAIRATRPSSVFDVAHGQNAFRGRTALEAGNPGLGLALTGQANAYDDFMKGQSQRDLLYDKAGVLNYPLAAALSGGAKELGGNVVTIGADGVPILGPVTAEGVARVGLLGTQGTNDTLRTTSQNTVDAARAGAITKTGDATVDLRQAQAGAVTTGAESKAENLSNLTQAQIDYLKSKGVNLSDLTAARVDTEGARKVAVQQGANDKSTLTGAKVEVEGARKSSIGQVAGDKSRETDARINRINANINNDALKAASEASKGADPIKAAQAEGQLRGTINQFYGKEFSDNLGKPGMWEQVDPAQKRSLTERTLEYVKGGSDLGTAMKKAEADHGLTGKTVKGQKSSFFGLKTSPDGKISFEGFTAPSALAAVTSAGSAPAAPTMAPAGGEIVVKTQADIDNAPSGAILIVNGKRMKKP